MSVDWNDQKLKHVLKFEQVSPTSLSKTLGTLDGVILSESSITAGYYTDARCQATIVLHNGNWKRGAYIRITDTVPEENWRRVLGTFVVTNDDARYEKGAWKTTLTCYSLIWTLSQDYRSSALRIKKRGSASSALKSICKTSRCACKDTGPEVFYKSEKVFPVGTTQLERIFEICDATQRRLDVAPDGTILFEKYKSRSSQSPKFTLNYAEANSLMHDDFARSSNLLELPDTAVVYYSWTETKKKGDESKEIKHDVTGEYSRTITTEAGTRPFRVAVYKQMSNNEQGVEEYTSKELSKEAKRYLESYKERIKWTGTIQYLPIWEGDVLTLILPDRYASYSGKQKVFVQEMTLRLDTMQIQVTLRSTKSGNEND